LANLDEDDDGIPCEALIGAPGSGSSSAAVIVVAAAQPATSTSAPRTTAAHVQADNLANTGAGGMNKFLVTGADLLALGGLTLLLARPRQPHRHRH
jgi:hypothetical protein